MRPRFWLALVLLSFPCSHSVTAAEPGTFQGDQDVGICARPGSAVYDPSSRSYTVSGGGGNMWFTNDAFHFVWKKVSGDLSLAADVIFEGTGGNAHRKACLMFRQSLDGDSAYVDAALHGDGLTSLQYREVQKGMTREVQCSVAAPKRLQLQKRGKNVSLFVGSKGGGLTPSGASIRVDLADPYYVGFAVC